MKKILGIVVLVLAAVSFMFGAANAYPVVYGDYNALFFNNAEVLLDKDSSGAISVGDTFWGTFQLNSIKAPSDLTGTTGPTVWGIGGGINPPKEVSGYFATDVTSILPPGVVDPTRPAIILGPAVADPNSILSPGEVARIFEDGNVDYNDSSQALALATATDGTFHSSLGLSGGYWYTLAPLTPPGAGDIGESFAGLNFVISPFLLSKVNDPNEGFFGSNVDMFFNSELGSLGNFGTPAGLTKMHFSSNDPAVYFPVPEPTSMLLLGLGMFGVAVKAVRRKKVA